MEGVARLYSIFLFYIQNGIRYKAKSLCKT